MVARREPICILPRENIRHVCQHLRNAGVSHRDGHERGAALCQNCPESACLLWEGTSHRAPQGDYLNALTDWLTVNPNVAAFARAYDVPQQTAAKWKRKIEKMGMTFYDNKLVCHPQRLAGYLQGDGIIPLTLDIDLTNRCNAACPECPGFKQTGTETLRSLDVDILLVEASGLGIKSVVFTGGGEPTLHSELIDLLGHAKGWKLETAVVTNGILLCDRPDIVEAIVRHCTWVRVSVDAGNREMYIRTHGVDQYEKVLLGLKALADEKKHQNSQVTIGAAYLTGQETIPGIDSCCEKVEEAGVDYFYLRPYLNDTVPVDIERYQNAHNNGHFEVIGAKAYEHLGNMEKDYSRCGFGWWVSVVMADGTVTWCCRMRDNPKYYLGNIHKEHLRDILKRRTNIEVDFKDCTVLCRGDEVNKFLEGKQGVMHEAFL